MARPERKTSVYSLLVGGLTLGLLSAYWTVGSVASLFPAKPESEFSRHLRSSLGTGEYYDALASAQARWGPWQAATDGLYAIAALATALLAFRILRQDSPEARARARTAALATGLCRVLVGLVAFGVNTENARIKELYQSVRVMTGSQWNIDTTSFEVELAVVVLGFWVVSGLVVGRGPSKPSV